MRFSFRNGKYVVTKRTTGGETSLYGSTEFNEAIEYFGQFLDSEEKPELEFDDKLNHEHDELFDFDWENLE